MNLALASLQMALLNDGVCEKPKGSNSGPEVNIFLKAVGLGPGSPWCMAFVYWCVNKAAADLDVKNPLQKTGGVMLQWNTTKCRKLTNRDKGIQPGHIFIMQFGNGTGHTGFVEKIKGGLVYTIEGNTNDDGSREGYEVARRQRTLSSIKGFIQLN